MTKDNQVVPIRGKVVESPTSVVVPVARKVSGASLLSPVEVRARMARDLTEVAIDTYRAAGRARTEGDAPGAALLVESADRALDLVREIGEEIAAL